MEFLLIMAVFLGLMFYMSSRAKKQQQAQRENLLGQLQPGTGVITIGGFYGRVVDVDGDVVTLESPSGVETIWSKTAIREVKEPQFAPVDEDDLAAPDVVVPDDPSDLTSSSPRTGAVPADEIEDRTEDEPGRDDESGRRDR